MFYLFAHFAMVRVGDQKTWSVFNTKIGNMLKVVDEAGFTFGFTALVNNLSRLNDNTWKALCDHLLSVRNSLAEDQKKYIYAVLKKNKLLTPEVREVFQGVENIDDFSGARVQ